MERQTVKSKKSSQRDGRIKVEWQHTQEPNLIFRRLMMILLKPREDSLLKRKVSNNFQRKTDTETDPETDTDTER